MPVLDWSRTHLNAPFKDSSTALSFDYPTFAVFDVFLLNRKGAKKDYSEELLRQAKGVLDEMSPSDQRLLQETGVALLPGTSFGRPTNELTTRLCFVDFDGDAALEHVERNGKIDQDDLNILFPKMVNGMDQLMEWVAKN